MLHQVSVRTIARAIFKMSCRRTHLISWHHCTFISLAMLALVAVLRLKRPFSFERVWRTCNFVMRRGGYDNRISQGQRLCFHWPNHRQLYEVNLYGRLV